VINQRKSAPQYSLSLFRREPAKIAAADLARASVQYLRLVPKPVAFDQGVIHGEIAAGGVLDEKRQIRRAVEKLGQHVHRHRQVVRRCSQANGFDCADFHILRSKYAKTVTATIATLGDNNHAALCDIGAADSASSAEDYLT
jgi:hypothetical protein